MMNLDGISLSCLRHELQELIGALVRQIYQPQPELLTLELWKGEELSLLISPAEGRLHLTAQSFANPAQAPAFAMLLRKYLKGGTIAAVEQPGLERLIRLVIHRGDAEYSLICELFGRGNIILAEDGKILGGLHQSGGVRPVLPHQQYLPPSSQGKLDPCSLNKEAFLRLLQGGEGQLWQVLTRGVEGLGPRSARELALRAELGPESPISQVDAEGQDRLWQELGALLARVKDGRSEPMIYYDGERPVDVAPFPLRFYDGLRAEQQASLSQALDEYFSARGAQASFSSEQARLLRLVREELKRLIRAMARVREDHKKAQDYERYRRWGDLVLANLARLEPGQREAELPDPRSGQMERLTLDPQLSPAENAQAFYNRYKKLKRGLEKLRERGEELQEEVEHLQVLELGLEQAEGPEDLQELAQELEAAGYLKEEEAEPRAPAGPREFHFAGFRVLVGRSGRENDLLVREAHREDLWLHARGLPGAHVLIKSGGRKVPPAVLERAARLAAYYSKGRTARKVEVTYTEVKYLRKPKGAKPGAVLLQHEEGTLLVPPEPEGLGPDG